ncbi:MAG: hypothetical protein BVN32_14120 [Proteobacteria bacterium ST_bin14]|nr:MAG: hypothetical protein BVN32_14120 [Proteobacteria bacterium ST_bin14]
MNEQYDSHPYQGTAGALASLEQPLTEQQIAQLDRHLQPFFASIGLPDQQPTISSDMPRPLPGIVDVIGIYRKAVVNEETHQVEPLHIPLHFSEREVRARVAAKIAERVVNQISVSCSAERAGDGKHICAPDSLCALVEDENVKEQSIRRVAAALLVPTQAIKYWIDNFTDGITPSDRVVSNVFSLPADLAQQRLYDLAMSPQKYNI